MFRLFFGDYKIIKAKLDYCGDKGISVGERSKLNLINGIIFNSKIGVASKDDAVTSIDNVMIKNIDTCLSAYNKKRISRIDNKSKKLKLR